MISDKDIQSRVLIYARPSATDVFPYTVQIFPNSLSAIQERTIIVRGKSFIYDVRSVYLSSSDPSIFENLNYTYYNPFSSSSKLHPKNPAFYGVSLSSFNIFNEKTLYFDIPNQVFYNINNKSKPFSTRIDVIVENEAGYGLLSRDSRSYRVSSWSGFVQEQKPCIYGIELYTQTPNTISLQPNVQTQAIPITLYPDLDTDNDQYSDIMEILYGTDVNDPTSVPTSLFNVFRGI